MLAIDCYGYVNWDPVTGGGARDEVLVEVGGVAVDRPASDRPELRVVPVEVCGRRGEHGRRPHMGVVGGAANRVTRRNRRGDHRLRLRRQPQERPQTPRPRRPPPNTPPTPPPPTPAAPRTTTGARYNPPPPGPSPQPAYPSHTSDAIHPRCQQRPV